MKNLVSVKAEMRMLGATKAVISKSEVRQLAEVLHQQENILGFVYGAYESAAFALLVATSKRIIFISKTPGNLIVDDIPYDMIASLEYNVGMLWGRVKLFARHKNYNFTFVNKRYIPGFAHVVEDLILKRSNK